MINTTIMLGFGEYKGDDAIYKALKLALLDLAVDKASIVQVHSIHTKLYLHRDALLFDTHEVLTDIKDLVSMDTQFSFEVDITDVIEQYHAKVIIASMLLASLHQEAVVIQDEKNIT